jgi:2-polyprenyl-6-methoxyphenol hydroxylase-like FAD-dependent oxidoreductase
VLEASSKEDFINTKNGAAAQLGPNGLRALNFISSSSSSSPSDDNKEEDMIQKVLSMGGILEGNVMMLPEGQQMTIPDTTQVDTGIPQVLVRWGMLRSLLVDQLPDDVVVTDAGKDIAGYELNNNSNDEDGSVTMIDSSGNPISNDFSSTPLIIGADGVRSTFRALVRKDVTHLTTATTTKDGSSDASGEDVKYGGRINIKAVVSKSLGEEYKSGHTHAAFAPDGSVAIFAGPAGDGATYWAISVADSVTGDGEGATTATFIDDLPINEADGKLSKESLKQKLLTKLNELDSTDYIQSVIALIDETDAEDIFCHKSEEAKELGNHPLHSKDGRIVLAGDAAHAMSASYGQAANFALEDAATLAACIRDGDNLVDALKDYSAKRLDRCIEMQTRSAERAAKAMKGEQVEDVSKWIFQWEIA